MKPNAQEIDERGTCFPVNGLRYAIGYRAVLKLAEETGYVLGISADLKGYAIWPDGGDESIGFGYEPVTDVFIVDEENDEFDVMSVLEFRQEFDFYPAAG